MIVTPKFDIIASYVTSHPAMDVLVKVERKPYNELNIDKAMTGFRQEVFGMGDGGDATYLGKTRGARKQTAINFFHAMEDLVKEVVKDVRIPSNFISAT